MLAARPKKLGTINGCHPERSEGSLQLFLNGEQKKKLRRSFASLRMTDFA
jgi:hypothetical protein